MTVLTICLSPGLQRSVLIDSLALGEVNRLDSVVVDVAGKGVNVCRVLQRLGVNALCLAQGGDNADEIKVLAGLEGLNLHLIPSSGCLRTCTSVIETAVAGGRRVTELIEPTAPVDAVCVAQMSEIVQAKLSSASALVIAGSMAPGFPVGYQAQMASWARRAGVPVFVDLQGEALREVVRQGPALVKINLSEFASTFLDDRYSGMEHSGVLAARELAPDLLEAACAVSSRYPVTFVLTRGPNSILLLRNGDLRICPVAPLPVQETLSTIGSGDTFMAALLARWMVFGLPEEDALTLHLVESLIDFAVACAQSNARTMRPGFLETGFMPVAAKIDSFPTSLTGD
jgi:fructose-1-phosphate kinase PfkB-like protein